MNTFNYEFQPISPMSDNEDWVKYIKSEDCSDEEIPQDMFDGPLDEFFSNEYSSYISSNQMNTPVDSSQGYKINLNSVNHKLLDSATTTDDDSSCQSSPHQSSSISSPDDLVFDSQKLSSATSGSGTTTASSQKKTKRITRKRAPRKKLTEHQKAAHNVIEKKYRININTKIESLQKLIPSVAREEPGFRTHSKADAENDSKSKKLNKSLILDKAIEYIMFLQQNQCKVIVENTGVKSRLGRYN
ncbi:Ty-mediated expression protein [Yamadazyma tenuis]|uniref:HLH-domain-containing protein n=1 Tax=Candida tenuis (strain ATCC 10573 / BCRC 21748 / CBS 615 / JCM 9827 / NBRC 10315 / NRRL Y-1498 / VKM Y-70) TaxID=590646 RepID=G3AZT9_CANTC|nr:HLH-domain-containing protein [Yamadazyma tenuis ATCC 10573]XP_006685154.1 uncharacterized protein CANTEDRAFT_112975 [Yamadazyma tenuis ATCC 10573]EGV65467.1 HLH-domain-containing protein [Yamadazyma tenuis ATCC 10573]EGV65468.1 hypothetical protein CANTEDRAFT_112975 [Yamadazyma tenuis ATCC 10573]WEJ95109.1 Ty-mediated expression protein [Yamadazyma tenuis]